MANFSAIKEIKKTRKVHICFLCSRDIQVGSLAFNWDGVYDGSFFHGTICPTCKKLLRYVKDQDGFCEGDMRQYVSDARLNTPEDLLAKFEHNIKE